MEDDDIEYDITFPSPSAGIDDSDEMLDDYVIEGESKEPVIILIGWAGCKPKHLTKYCKIYEKRCITIQYIPPTDVSYVKPKLMTNLAKKVLDLIKDFNLEANPIFFHIFSNNGSFMYTEITKLLTSPGNKYRNLQVKGTIIDSAPGKRRVMRAAWAFAIASGQRGLARYIAYIGMMFYLVILRVYLFFLMLFSGDNSANPNHVYNDIKEDKTRWPQLFIFSDADKVIPASDITEIAEYRRDRFGVTVDTLQFEDTDHVAHFKDHPEAYTLKCNTFLDKCLKGNRDVECIEKEIPDQ
ncbi:transmembrane protein 53-like [Saccostrea echinata]|uniref:transmembrane protein 53-like n=1 Tax=Saccostrea echinata TaxID=191078 RepID=UPI002A823471|nr:transmembrane protein 53-like [Saccostrea echinata]